MTTTMPRPEYPRPDRDRSHRWLCLNGTWDFEHSDATGETVSVPIVVPFAWETAASGVCRTWLERATYRRSVSVPADWAGQRVFLCFGAVHHHARVTINGVPIGEHSGGYVPFEIDVTDELAPGQTGALAVEVHAPQDKRAIPHGKQRSIPRDDYDGVSFTPSSGIWQSVWLEARGRTYLDHASVRGDSLAGFDVEGVLAGDAPAEATVDVSVHAGSTSCEAVIVTSDAQGRFSARLTLADPRPWSPEDPHLYTLRVRVGGASGDTVHLTGGLRRIETRGEDLYLNGERLYLRGVLDQGYWPGSGLTAADDAAHVADLGLAARLGYNLVRKHIKLEDPRWLHHADRMGMLVWAEPPGPSRFSPAAREAFETQLEPMVRRDGNHPSIIIWGLYNEEWGLDWDISGSADRADAARHAYDTLQSLDHTRPIVDNSGWAHVRTDLVDWHYYDDDPGAWAANLAAMADGRREDFPVRLGPDFVVHKALYGAAEHPRRGLPLLNSEYGAGFTSLERGWHLRWQTQEIRRHDRFGGYVYTELADVEHEMAGIVDADRRVKDLGGLDPADANAPTVLVIDIVPKQAGADIAVPTEPLAVAVHVSHHGSTPVAGRVRAGWTVPGSPVAALPRHDTESEIVKVSPFQLSGGVTVVVPPLGEPAGRLVLWFVDDEEAVLARAYVDAGPIEPLNRRGGSHSG